LASAALCWSSGERSESVETDKGLDTGAGALLDRQ
jgi:hypothetical protein